jgi:5-methylphenazine-1-carboxylate 1-monooxygenase
MQVVIAGGGIGGLTAALSLHRIGVDVSVYETVDKVGALGVGINLLPHAVRELEVLGVLDELLAQAVAPERLGYFTKRGEEIWHESRGLQAGYRWPQISIHRGVLQQVLLAAVIDRIGADHVHTGYHLTGFEQKAEAATAIFVDRRTGAELARPSADVLVACDGIHSQARKQLYPNEGSPIWNGAKLWRGLAEGPKMLDGRSQVWAGHRNQKFVAYPIRDLPGDRQQINFIAELRYEDEELAEREDWNQPGVLEEFLPSFEGWKFDWLDVPGLIRQAPGTFLFPMVDRDPVDQWSFGRVTLLGDAAHPMYPVGSNGASQAILDAQTLAGCIRSYADDVEQALAAYDAKRRPTTGAIVLANRRMGPELPMQLVEDRAPDGFAALTDVITPDEVLVATEGYRKTAGFALSELHERPSLADLAY